VVVVVSGVGAAGAPGQVETWLQGLVHSGAQLAWHVLVALNTHRLISHQRTMHECRARPAVSCCVSCCVSCRVR
jgi:hypothetical protein